MGKPMSLVITQKDRDQAAAAISSWYAGQSLVDQLSHAIATARDEGRAEQREVAPLEWQEHTDGDEWFSQDDPTGENLGLYWVRPGKINRGWWDLLIAGHRIDDYPTQQEAKDAADENYRARIAAAIRKGEP